MSEVFIAFMGLGLITMVEHIMVINRLDRLEQNNMFGKYPCNDYLNNALRFLLRNSEGDRELAIEEIVYAIRKADGYLCDDVKEKINELKGDQEGGRNEKRAIFSA